MYYKAMTTSYIPYAWSLPLEGETLIFQENDVHTTTMIPILLPLGQVMNSS